MSPLDDQLRQTLRRHADDLPPPTDPYADVERSANRLRRQHIALATTGALAVAAVAIVGGLALTGSSTDTLQAPPASDGAHGSTPTAESTPTPSPAGSLETYAYLGWPMRSGPGTAALEFADDVLWGGELPDGTFVVIRQADVEHQARAVAVLTPKHGDDYTITGAVLRESTREVSFVLPGGAYPWVLVIGEPGTAQIEYAADGTSYEPAETVEGWSLFSRTGPTATSEPIGRDAIRVLDGNGDINRPLYEGPIDAGPTRQDK